MFWPNGHPKDRSLSGKARGRSGAGTAGGTAQAGLENAPEEFNPYDFEQLTGIGPARETALYGAGYASLMDLALADPQALADQISGVSPDGVLPEIVEYQDHPWFIGVQYHPELKSRPFEPHPLFASFIHAAVVQSRLV